MWLPSSNFAGKNAYFVLIGIFVRIMDVHTPLASSSGETWWKRTRQAASLRDGGKTILRAKPPQGNHMGCPYI